MSLVNTDRNSLGKYVLVPLSFDISPYLLCTSLNTLGKTNIEKKILYSHMFEYLSGIDNSYEDTVLFNEFINGLNENDFNLTYKGKDIKTYEDYLNFIVLPRAYWENMNIDFDLSRNNMKR